MNMTKIFLFHDCQVDANESEFYRHAGISNVSKYTESRLRVSACELKANEGWIP